MVPLLSLLPAEQVAPPVRLTALDPTLGLVLLSPMPEAKFLMKLSGASDVSTLTE